MKWSRAGSQPVNVEMRTQGEKKLGSVKDFTKRKTLVCLCGCNIVFPRLQVVSTSSNIAVVEKEVHRGFPSFCKYTVSAVDPQAALTASVSINSPSYGQTLVIPVTLIHVAGPSATAQGGCPFCDVTFPSISVFH